MNDTQTIYITADELAAINAARTALAAIAERAYFRSHDTHASGSVNAKADTAAEALFSLVNWTSTYGGQDFTDEQIHNRPRPVEQDAEGGDEA